MRESFKHLMHDRMIFWTFTLAVVLLLFQILFLIFSFRVLPPLIPLLYQQAWGTRQIVVRELIFLLPLVSLAFMVTNTTFGTVMYRNIPLLSRMFFWGNLFTTTLATISSVRIVILVT